MKARKKHHETKQNSRDTEIRHELFTGFLRTNHESLVSSFSILMNNPCYNGEVVLYDHIIGNTTQRELLLYCKPNKNVQELLCYRSYESTHDVRCPLAKIQCSRLYMVPVTVGNTLNLTSRDTINSGPALLYPRHAFFAVASFSKAIFPPLFSLHHGHCS
jgi:hypothetical protein